MRPVSPFRQSLGILALSLALAFAANAVRPGGLPLLYAAKSAVQLDEKAGEIAIKDAALLFVTARAVFLDARSQFEYDLGHIQGAIHLPPREFAAQYQDVKPKLAGKEAVIVYCDGEQCPLSHSLAKHLRDAGLKNVYILVNGWTLWNAEKLPVSGAGASQPAPFQASGPAPAAKPAAKASPASAPKKSTAGKQCTAETCE